MIVLVCGGRDFTDAAQIDEVLSGMDATLIIDGGATGADQLANFWAIARGISTRTFYADWSKGLAAGPARNQQMLTEGQPDVVVAFAGGKGTADMVRRARKAHVMVIDVLPRDEASPGALRP